MKAVNVYFEDEEIEEFEKLKGEMSWHDFFVSLVEKKKAKKNDKIEVIK